MLELPETEVNIRHKRESTQLRPGCHWGKFFFKKISFKIFFRKSKIFLVFGDGTTEARFNQEFSLQEKFFRMLDPNIKRFQLSLNTTRTIFNGVKNISSYGYTEFIIIINDPPENGSCSILGFYQKDQKWLDTSVGLGLVQEFKLNCDNKWVDPNNHKIQEYVFKSKRQK